MDAPFSFDMPGALGRAGEPYDQPPMVARERRLHARAYQHWMSLRGGRRVPDIADLHPRALAEFAMSGVLVELGSDAGPPVIHFLGQAIAAEAVLDADRPAFDSVPRVSLLGQLLRRLPIVRDRGVPVSFEADFPGRDGAPTHYRGVLLPFADESGEIAYVFGVISWKLVAAGAIDADVAASLGSALALAPAATVPSAWAIRPAPTTNPLPLAQQLAAARTWVALGQADRGRRTASLKAALSAAHDLRIATDADPAQIASLAARQVRGRPGGVGEIVRLVFGAQATRIARARNMAVLLHARRLGIGPGMLLSLLDRHPGGADGLAAAERRARQIERHGGRSSAKSTSTNARPSLSRIEFSPVDADHLLLLAQRGPRRLDPAAPTTDLADARGVTASRRFAAS